ncbi:hypothetical protein ACWT_2113 [Actinoplanes sp. SE50]|uniref:type VII secretion target n=1 Tax=unclassified Actinoplanes TaxID=2626549 RepID=UPI00023EC91C|nr:MULTISPECIES: type VII secretion target [unclassified Actinoplanes]AEV83134.1 hypothetical protein ACPL_2237 [Actinoplanes sp. SE50/110]ATO81528.1 hypothetical protein ACWT_2113 [Actinoplanes sp. SE50]SLL98935.1 hypothetical protein ACSP50_2162 [Actinoplanes sp. SE50/110]
MPVLQVDAEALGGIGRNVADAFTTLQGAVTASGARLAPAPWPVSAAATAAQAAEKAWSADLRRLTGEIDEYGRSLTAAAQTYQGTDRDNAHDLHGGGAGAGR